MTGSPFAASQQVSLPENLVDADDGVYQVLRQGEATRRPDPRCLRRLQTEVDARMRAVLVDWLEDVGEEFELRDDTLFLAVDLLDRFLSKEAIQRSELQLVGAACMWLAAKYEEKSPPSSQQMVGLTEDTYTTRELAAMERRILKALSYEIGRPTAINFLDHLLEIFYPEQAENASVPPSASTQGGQDPTQLGVPQAPGPQPSKPAALAAFLDTALMQCLSGDDSCDSSSSNGHQSRKRSHLARGASHLTRGAAPSKAAMHAPGSIRRRQLSAASSGSLPEEDIIEQQDTRLVSAGWGGAAGGPSQSMSDKHPIAVRGPCLQRSNSGNSDDSCSTGIVQMDAGSVIGGSCNTADGMELSCCFVDHGDDADADNDDDNEEEEDDGSSYEGRLDQPHLVHHLSRLICEASLLDHGMTAFLPSQVASSSLLLAHMLLQAQHVWTPELQRCSGYRMCELAPCTLALAEAHSRCLGNAELLALEYKYSTAERMGVAALPLCLPLEQLQLGRQIAAEQHYTLL